MQRGKQLYKEVFFFFSFCAKRSNTFYQTSFLDKPARLTIRFLWFLFLIVKSEVKANRETVPLSTLAHLPFNVQLVYSTVTKQAALIGSLLSLFKFPERVFWKEIAGSFTKYLHLKVLLLGRTYFFSHNFWWAVTMAGRRDQSWSEIFEGTEKFQDFDTLIKLLRSPLV